MSILNRAQRVQAAIASALRGATAYVMRRGDDVLDSLGGFGGVIVLVVASGLALAGVNLAGVTGVTAGVLGIIVAVRVRDRV